MAGHRAPPTAARDDALRGWTLLSLRPAGQHGGVRAAAARHGARVLALSPLTIRRCDDAATRAQLRLALAAPLLIATSPNAVRAAAAMQPLAPKRGQQWLDTIASLRDPYSCKA